jgi:phage shock protein A
MTVVGSETGYLHNIVEDGVTGAQPSGGITPSTQRLAETYQQQAERQQAEYQTLLDAKLKLEAKLTTVKQERDEMQSLLDLARSKELTTKTVRSLDNLTGSGDRDIARLAESIRTRLDKATARGEMQASRLDSQMDDLFERRTLDAQLAERRKRLAEKSVASNQ